jgi:hypothetical protein
VETSKDILTELLDVAPFLGKAGMSRVPYAVPKGYFADFTDILLRRIRIEMEVISEPQAGQEIADLSPLLAGLQKNNPYKLPEGYFESRQINIPSSGKNPAVPIFERGQAKEVPIISIESQPRRVFNFSRVLKYAVAACLVAMLGTTLFNISTHIESDPILGLAVVSDQDMANYLDSDDIHWTPGLSSATESTTDIASVDLNDNDIRDLLSNVPDDELEQYSALLPEEKGTVN